MLSQKIAKIRLLLDQKGIYFVLRRTWYRALCPRWVYLVFFSSRRFEFRGERYPYFYRAYNTAWRNERTVEIPIFASLLKQYADNRILEVGNVLAHYLPGVRPGTSHVVVDKYEVANGVLNEDVVTYDAEPYDLIISISTLEHVGWDETPRDARKVLRAVDNLKRLVKPGGQLVVSMPINYHPPLDEAIREGAVTFDDVTYLKRISQFNTWQQVEAQSVRGAIFDDPYPGASAIVVCRWRP